MSLIQITLCFKSQPEKTNGFRIYTFSTDNTFLKLICGASEFPANLEMITFYNIALKLADNEKIRIASLFPGGTTFVYLAKIID